MAGSEGRVYYGQTFTAPCSNDFWQEETGAYRDCDGTVTFGPTDRQAACGTCGAQCGRLVAFGLPSGDPYYPTGPAVPVVPPLPFSNVVLTSPRCPRCGRDWTDTGCLTPSVHGSVQYSAR